MVLKTFNLDSEVYDKFSQFCKAHGISMSKQINIFINSQIAEEPKVRGEYLKKLTNIRKRGTYKEYHSFGDFEKRFN